MGGCRTIYASITMGGGFFFFCSLDGGRTISAGFCLIANRWAVVRFCNVPRRVMMSVNVRLWPKFVCD